MEECFSLLFFTEMLLFEFSCLTLWSICAPMGHIFFPFKINTGMLFHEICLSFHIFFLESSNLCPLEELIAYRKLESLSLLISFFLPLLSQLSTPTCLLFLCLHNSKFMSLLAQFFEEGHYYFFDN